MDFQAAEITRLGKLNNRLREDYEILAGKYDIENAQLQYELKKNNGELQELKYKMEDLKKMKYRGTT